MASLNEHSQDIPTRQSEQLAVCSKCLAKCTLGPLQLETLPTEIIIDILKYVIPVGGIMIIDPRRLGGTKKGVPYDSLNIALVSIHLANLAFYVLSSNRWFEIGAEEIIVHPYGVDTSSPAGVGAQYGSSIIGGLFQQYLNSPTTIPAAHCLTFPRAPVIHQSQWGFSGGYKPEQHHFDTAMDQLGILLSHTYAWQHMQYLSIQMGHDEAQDFVEPFFRQLLNGIPKLRVLRVVLSLEMAMEVSAGCVFSTYLLGFAYELDHVQEVSVTTAEAQLQPNSELTKLIAKLSQRNSYWAVCRGQVAP